MAQDLLDDEQSRAFDLLDELGAWGVQHIVPLPQLVVCGDQSCGKSSLMEAISGFTFPVDAEQCTRFPTQIVLRRSALESTSVSIVPGERASAAERQRLKAFVPSSTSVEALQDTVREAKQAMELGDGFTLSDNVLRLEISGPTRPHLTLVDLPGLISSTSDKESEVQIPMVENLVRQYMENPRAIVLAVISASNDQQNQRVLTLMKDYDKAGLRTIAVVTKPDLIQNRDKSRKTYLSFIQNERIRLQLGWHVVRNIDREDDDTTVYNRDAEESKFFSQEPWTSLSPDQMGVSTLKTRLSACLAQQFSKELPEVIKEVQSKLQCCNTELKRLGKARSSSSDQRNYLTDIAEQFRPLVDNALAARYNSGMLLQRPMQLRTRIGELQHSLSSSTRAYGSRFDVECTHSFDLGRGDVSLAKQKQFIQKYSEDVEFATPEKLTCQSHARDIAERMLGKSVGLHLPTLTDSSLLWDVFKDLSTPWRHIVDTHVSLTLQEVNNFVLEAFKQLASEHTYDVLLEHVLVPSLEDMGNRLEHKKNELMAPYEEFYSLSWNLDMVQQLILCQDARPELSTGNNDPLAEAEYVAAFRLVHQVYAYYKTVQSTMVDNIAALAIENCLLSDLKKLFTAAQVSAMDDQSLELLGGEAADAAASRKANEQMKSALSKALKRCRDYEMIFRRRAVAGDRSGRGDMLSNSSTVLPSRVRGDNHTGLNATPPRQSVHTRSRSADFARVSVNEAYERQAVPPLTPHRSPSPSLPRIITPADEDRANTSDKGMYGKSDSTGSPSRPKIDQGPHVVVEEELEFEELPDEEEEEEEEKEEEEEVDE